jgi:hypothetical protein
MTSQAIWLFSVHFDVMDWLDSVSERLLNDVVTALSVIFARINREWNGDQFFTSLRSERRVCYRSQEVPPFEVFYAIDSIDRQTILVLHIVNGVASTEDMQVAERRFASSCNQ